MSKDEFEYRIDKERFDKYRKQFKDNKGFFKFRGNKFLIADIILIALVGIFIYAKPYIFKNKISGCQIISEATFQKEKLRVHLSVKPNKVFYYEESLPILDININYDDKIYEIKDYFKNDKIEKIDNNYDLYIFDIEKGKKKNYFIEVSDRESNKKIKFFGKIINK